MNAPATPTGVNESQYVQITPKEYANRALLRLILKYKNRLPDEAINRINAALPTIMNLPSGAKPDIHVMFPDDMPRESPLYIQGDAGVGKTEIPEGAARKFCAIAGLNFVKDPPEGFVPGDSDFVYTVIDMSGKTSISDVAGAISKIRIGGSDKGGISAKDMLSVAAQSIALYSGVEFSAGARWDANDAASGKRIDFSSIVFKSADPQATKEAAETVAEAVIKVARERGLAAGILPEGAQASRIEQINIQISPNRDGSCSLIASELPANQAVDAAALLPSKQLARLGMAKFGLLMIDDLGNCPQHLRNIFLQLSLNGVVEGICDLRHADMVITANPPKTKHGQKNKNVISERSFPEITRSQTFDLVASPRDWIEWLDTQQFFNTHGNAHFRSFVSMHGDKAGMFQMHHDASSYEDGAPVPVPRSVTRAMIAATKWFTAARGLGFAETPRASEMFRREIVEDVASCVGKEFAFNYIAHVTAMESEAIPMASECLEKGKIDTKKFAKSADSKKSDGLDFSYRFAYALADVATSRMNFSNDDVAKKLRHVMLTNMFKGLAVLPPSIRDASLARFVGIVEARSDMGEEALDRASGRKVTIEFANEIARAFGEAAGAFDDPDVAAEDVSRIVSSHRTQKSDVKVGAPIKPR